jgi:hypothetical protein
VDLAQSTAVRLRVPPLPRLVPDGVFDAFGWCETGLLEWRRPVSGFDASTRLTAANPPRMVFVLRGPCDYLPRELARLHVPGLGLEDEWALAPYGIDDATDELYARRVRPGSLLWLAADSVNALFWGLHDWSHFHNHGPFEEVGWTELQCDAAALSWLWHNRRAIGMDEEAWGRTVAEAVGLARARFHAEGIGFDPEELLTRSRAWVSSSRARSSGEGGRGGARRARSTTGRR